MSISSFELLNKTSAELIVLRNNYVRQRADLPRMHRSGHKANALSADLRICDDAIKAINEILRVRSKRNAKPLATFR